GKGLDLKNNGVDNIKLIKANEAIRSTGVENIGKKLRIYMSAMKPI
nr:ketol-acid reductoisomerase [Candidatus Desulfobacula maris]